MKNLKIRANSIDESREIQNILESKGFKKWTGWSELESIGGFIWTDSDMTFCDNKIEYFDESPREEITIPELRAMANPMKEYLMPSKNYEYILTDAREALEPHAKDWIEIPDGAEAFGYTGIVHTFYKDDFRSFFNENTNGQWDERSETWIGRKDPVILWQREQDDPFLTPECTLNDQYAEVEEVRQVEIHRTVKSKPDFNFGAAEASGGAKKDKVNHPSHYTQGKVECIDALESATIGKSGIEAVCVANIVKYLWRYEEKNGVEDVKKAKFYLNRLLATLENKP